MEGNKKSNDYCPVHNLLTQEIERINEMLWGLQRERHDIRIDKLESEMNEQKKFVDEMRRIIWIWKGSLMLAAFIGSIVGTILIKIFLRIER